MLIGLPTAFLYGFDVMMNDKTGGRNTYEFTAVAKSSGF